MRRKELGGGLVKPAGGSPAPANPSDGNQLCQFCTRQLPASARTRAIEDLMHHTSNDSNAFQGNAQGLFSVCVTDPGQYR